MNKPHTSLLATLSLILLAASGASTPALADPTDPDIIPPEVIVPLSMPPGSVPPGAANPTSAPPAQPAAPTMPVRSNYGGGGPSYTPPGVAPPNPQGPAAGSGAVPMGVNPGQSQPYMNPRQAMMQQLGGMQQPGQQAPAAGGSMQNGWPANAAPQNFGPGANPQDCPGCNQHKNLQNTANTQGILPPVQAPVSAVPSAVNGQKDPLAVIETTKGTIVIRLFRQHAPQTVANFVELASKGFYNGLTWHRVEPGFCIQTGCPKGDGSGSYVDPVTNQPRRIKLELNPQLRHNAAGVVAMARFGNDPHSASSQFYITLNSVPHLDNKYAIFGGVVRGGEIIHQITKSDKIITLTVQEQQ